MILLGQAADRLETQPAARAAGSGAPSASGSVPAVLRSERASGRAWVEMSDGLSDRLRSVAVDRLGRDHVSLRKTTVQHDAGQVTRRFKHDVLMPFYTGRSEIWNIFQKGFRGVLSMSRPLGHFRDFRHFTKGVWDVIEVTGILESFGHMS